MQSNISHVRHFGGEIRIPLYARFAADFAGWIHKRSDHPDALSFECQPRAPHAYILRPVNLTIHDWPISLMHKTKSRRFTASQERTMPSKGEICSVRPIKSLHVCIFLAGIERGDGGKQIKRVLWKASIGILITRHLSFHSQMHFSCSLSSCIREFALHCYVFLLCGVSTWAVYSFYDLLNVQWKHQ